MMFVIILLLQLLLLLLQHSNRNTIFVFGWKQGSGKSSSSSTTTTTPTTFTYWEEIIPPIYSSTYRKEYVENYLFPSSENDDNNNSNKKESTTARRPFFWFKTMDEIQYWKSSSNQSLLQKLLIVPLSTLGGGQQQQQQQLLNEPHPLRTDKWDLSIFWLGRNERYQRKQYFKPKIEIEFHPNGYCRSRVLTTIPSLVSSSSSSSSSNIGTEITATTPTTTTTTTKDVIGIGQWKLWPWGIIFTIPIKTINTIRGISTTTYTTYHCHADFHINAFGQQPKITNGIILRQIVKKLNPNDNDDYDYDNDNNDANNSIINNVAIDNWDEDSIDRIYCTTNGSKKKWFRPVIGLFSGNGIGQDTADWSYQKRGFGL